MIAAFRSALVVSCALAAAPLSAQRVRGEVLEKGTNVPVVGAFVALLDGDDVELTRVMTDALGRFTVSMPSRGSYRLRATAVGRASFISASLTLASGETATITIALPKLAVALPALVVEADRECRVRPEAGLGAAALWEEARKALEAVVWTERRGTLRHLLAQYDRRLDPRTLEVLEQGVSRRDGVYRGSPFVSRSPRLLVEEGFVRELPTGEWEYYGPDAAVLLSDAFADVHCFAVAQQDRERPDLVALAFEPTRGRDVGDIEGKLWLDARTAELRHLEYRYTNLPDVIAEVGSRVIGGRVVFRRLPEGPWIVERWWIRMPEIGLRRRALLAGHVPVLLGVREQGGWVEEVHALDGRVVWQAPSSQISGTVRWLDAPLEGAELELIGADRTVRADRAGRFRFDQLVPGTYALVVRHPNVDPGRAIQPPTPAVVGSGDSLVLDVLLESPPQVRARLCPEGGEAEPDGMLAGLVRESVTGAVVPDARVRAAWQLVSVAGGVIQRHEASVSASSDEWGYYYFCRLPADVTLSVGTDDERFAERTWELVIGDSLVARQDIAVARRRP